MDKQQTPRKSIKQSLDVNLTEYTQETTIHGLKYLNGRNRSLPERIFWITIFIVSFSCLSYFIYKLCKAWMEHPIMITEQQTPTQIFEIPFPAITICPAIKIKRDAFNILDLNDEIQKLENPSTFWSSDYGKKFILVSQICRRSFEKHTRPILNGTDGNLLASVTKATIDPEMIRALYDISPNRDDSIKRCRMSNWNWDDIETLEATDKNCQSLFSTIMTNEGVCFTFNTIQDVLRMNALHTDFDYHDIKQKRDGWEPDIGYTKDRALPYKGMVRGSYFGVDGVKFVLVANMSDASPHCEPLDLGYKLVLNSPAAYPHMYEKYLSLQYGKEYKISIIPKAIYTANDLRSFRPESRQCYFNDERRLKFFTFYNEINCRLECYANFTFNICQGTPFSSPRDANTSNCVLPSRNYAWYSPRYFGFLHEYNKHYPLSKDIMDYKSMMECDCLPECNSIRYEYEILKSYDDVKDVDKFNEANSSDIVRTTVKIFFNNPSFIGEKRVRVLTFETVISDFGGLLGLFMGGSVLSFFELIYFLTIRNCFKKNE